MKKKVDKYVKTKKKITKKEKWVEEGKFSNYFHIMQSVISWPSTNPSIKRCTWVNKWRNSGSRWARDNYITRCHRRLGSVPVGVGISWGQDASVRAMAGRGLWALSDPASVVYWPPTRPNMPFQRWWKLHILLASYGKRLRRQAWLTIWDRVKISRCSHKLMDRKRVTCELHDSYFRLMMIKHAIPRMAEVTYSIGQLWEEIKWA